MSKRTAVQYLMDELSKNHCIYVPYKFWDRYKELVEFAKRKEREQIQDAHLAGQNSAEEENGETEIEYYKSVYGELS
jgi:hypothetical protein